MFDQRVALAPGQSLPTKEDSEDLPYTPVGRCVVCDSSFNELCGSRICTVCRDFVLLCGTCQIDLFEYHCKRHAFLKDCYFTFLERFDAANLQIQHEKLTQVLMHLNTNPGNKNVRKTVVKQMDKVTLRMESLRKGRCFVDKSAPRRCRSWSMPSRT